MNGEEDQMKTLIRILFTLFALAALAVPVQAALTPKPSKAPKVLTAKHKINSKHPKHPMALPADITAKVPGRHIASAGQVQTNARKKTPKVIYLTFDDGSGGAYTLEVLADLNAAGAHATFFETGDTTSIGALGGAAAACNPLTDTCSYPTSGMGIAANAGIAAQLLAAGNQIGTHSWDHPDFPAVTTAAATATEIGNARAYQVTATGHDSKLFRYPYLDPSRLANQYLKSQGMKAVPADIEPDDWKSQAEYSDAQVIKYVTSRAYNGAIVDLHDGTDALTRVHPTYLPALLSQLAAAGYTFGTIPSV